MFWLMQVVAEQPNHWTSGLDVLLVPGRYTVTLGKLFTQTPLFTKQCTSVAPPGFCNGGEVRYGSIGGLEYEVPQSRLYCLCINMALCSMALQCICRVTRRSSMTMKAHTYYIIFGRPPIGGGNFPLFPPWRRHWCTLVLSKVDDLILMLGR